MPRSAIATGVVDLVMPVQELAVRLGDLIRLKATCQSRTSRRSTKTCCGAILAHLRMRTGHDFAKYKRSTVLRRIARRMQVTRTDELNKYHDVLRENPEEAQALLSDLLISVTTFFRDSDSFDELHRSVIPLLFKECQHDQSLRVWVAGCCRRARKRTASRCCCWRNPPSTSCDRRSRCSARTWTRARSR